MRFLLRIGLLVCAAGITAAGIGASDARAAGCAPTALNFGASPTAGTIGAAAEVDCFSFTGAAGDRVRIRIAETSGTLGTLVTVLRPNLSVGCAASKATEINCTLNAAGTWTINVQDSVGNRTGDYRIAIQRLNTPLGCTGKTMTGASSTGTIGFAAEMDCYTFSSLSSSQVVRIRVAETGASPTLVPRYDVVRPDGTIVCAATTDLDLNCQLDGTGTHAIVISDSTGSQTGTYAIAIRRLDSPTGCTSLNFGAAPASGTISAAAELDCFRFDGSIDDQIRIRATPTSGTLLSPSKQFVRPDGTTFPFSVCCVQLDTTGTHKVIVGDSNGTGAGIGAYKISIQRLNNPVGCTPLDFGAAPLANVVAPGEMDCYTLSGSAADRVHFHLVPSEFDDVANIALFRPGGTGLCNAFTQLDHAVNLTCSLDEGGAHTVIVESSNPATSYSLSTQRLNNPVGCTPIGFGDAPTGGSITGAEMDCYTFDAAAGDQVRVRQTRTSGTQSGLDVAVFRPDGELVGCSFDPFEDPLERTCPIDTTGTYTMLQFDDPIVEPGTGSYAVGIQRLNGPVGCTPLSFGAAPVAGSIAAAAETDCYTFSGAPGAQIQIALPITTGFSPHDADVVDPSGEVICNVTVLPCPLAAAGTHAILVDLFSHTATGDYAVAVQRLNNPPAPTCTALTFGAAPTTASISAAGEMDCYTFAGTPGDQVRIRLVSTSGTLSASNEVAQTDGTLVCGHATAPEVTCPLDVTGQHRIIVSDNSFGKDTGGYAVAIQRLNTPGNCTALTFGAAPTARAINAAAEMDCFSFNGTAGDRIRVHATASGALAMRGEILRANGTTLCSGLGGGSSPADLTCRLDTTGPTRLLMADATGLLAGGYTIVVQRLNNPVGCAPLNFGAAPTARTIAAAGEIDCFTFSGAAGDRVQERPIATSGTLAVAGELVRPNGTTVSSATCMPCSLDSPGTYTILVGDSAGTGTGNYALAIQRLNNPVGCTPIVFGATPTTGTVAAGEIDCFTFAGTTGDRIHANLVKTSGTALTAQLFNPTGSQVCVFDPSSPPSSPFACGLTAVGTHTLIVSGLVGGNGAGDYSLAVQRANNPVGCTALGFGGAPTTGTIALTAEEDCFTFTGNAGDRIRFRPVETSGTLGFQSDVLRPSGTVACTNTKGIFNSGDFTCAVTVSGTHTLVLGDSAGTRTGDYAVVIQRLNAPVGCTALPVAGTPAVGSIGAAGELDCFTVAATAGTTIPLDLAATSGTVVPLMEVVRTNGTTRCPPTAAAHLDCKADTTGTYTVLVGDSSPRTRTGGYTLTRTS